MSFFFPVCLSMTSFGFLQPMWYGFEFNNQKKITAFPDDHGCQGHWCSYLADVSTGFAAKWVARGKQTWNARFGIYKNRNDSMLLRSRRHRYSWDFRCSPLSLRPLHWNSTIEDGQGCKKPFLLLGDCVRLCLRTFYHHGCHALLQGYFLFLQHIK